MNTIMRKVVWLIMLLPAIYLAIMWAHIPQTVPLHFNLKGIVDKYGSKNDLLILVLSLTLVNAVMYLIVSNIYKIDPKKYAAQNKSRLQRIGFYTVAYLSAIWIALIYEMGNNDLSKTTKFVFIAVGVLFALLGSNMYNIQPNYFAGLRLPWTLENEDNWRKTHHLAGRLWFYGGLFFAILVFLLNDEWISYAGAVILSLLILIPVAYSYIIYKNQTKTGI